MGIVYKLKPEIKDYILEKKKEEPILSCRSLVSLLEKKFQIRVSKSSVNSIFKKAGLSQSVGRRRKRRRKTKAIQVPQFEESSGLILLKALDNLVKGSHLISQKMSRYLKFSEAELLAKLEAILETKNEEIIPQGVPLPAGLFLEVLETILSLFEEVLFIKLTSSHKDFYLDAQFHTLWTNPAIPYNFSATFSELRSGIKRYFQEDKPLIILTAPGYNTIPQNFFDFISQLEEIKEITLYTNRLEEKENLLLEESKKSLLFGLWPWQFQNFRQINIIGEFKPLSFRPLKKDFYIAQTEVELLQPNINQRIKFKGSALRTSLSEKIRIFILSNLSEINLEELVNLYLSYWPNLEEGFLDFSKKIESFTYSPKSHSFFSPQDLRIKELSQNINSLFDYYLKLLDAYLRWHFLPFGYEDKDFQVMQERFYSLKTFVNFERDSLFVNFLPPLNYPFLKDLQYLCLRLNEREIISAEGKRYWFLV